MHKSEALIENKRYKIPKDFEIQKNYPIQVKRQDLVLINMKKRTCDIVDFAEPTDHRLTWKENQKLNKFLDLVRELKKVRNMNVTLVSIVVW